MTEIYFVSTLAHRFDLSGTSIVGCRSRAVVALNLTVRACVSRVLGI